MYFLFKYDFENNHRPGEIIERSKMYKACWKLFTVENGYCHTHGIGWSAPWVEPKRLSKKSLASMRRKRLKTRLNKKFPLLADQLHDQELRKRPRYYAGERNVIE